MSAPELPDGEHAYIGALLWLPAADAARAHGWLTDDDFTDVRLTAIHRMAGDLARQGIDPNPTAVLLHARSTGHTTTEDGLRSLALLLADLYDHRVTVPAAIGWYAQQALSESLRRRMYQAGVRIQQAGYTADLDDLIHLARTEAAAVRAQQQRLADHIKAMT